MELNPLIEFCIYVTRLRYRIFVSMDPQEEEVEELPDTDEISNLNLHFATVLFEALIQECSSCGESKKFDVNHALDRK